MEIIFRLVGRRHTARQKQRHNVCYAHNQNKFKKNIHKIIEPNSKHSPWNNGFHEIKNENKQHNCLSKNGTTNK